MAIALCVYVIFAFLIFLNHEYKKDDGGVSTWPPYLQFLVFGFLGCIAATCLTVYYASNIWVALYTVVSYWGIYAGIIVYNESHKNDLKANFIKFSIVMTIICIAVTVFVFAGTHWYIFF